MKNKEQKHQDTLKITYMNTHADESFYQQAFSNANQRISDFVISNELHIDLSIPFIKEAVIYGNQEDLISDCCKLFHIEDRNQLPKTLSAVLENQVFRSISKELYQMIYPIEGSHQDGFEKLITHEIAHRLHIRLLNGDEEKMGPKWFYEGFAIYVADQLKSSTIHEDLLWEIIDQDLDTNYIYYGPIFRYFMHDISLQEFINKSYQEDFVTWLKSLHNHSKGVIHGKNT